MRRIAVILFLAPLSLSAQTATWSFRSRIELRANYRDSNAAKFPLRFPFESIQLPVGQTVGFEETVDPGHHAELSVAQIRLDASYGTFFAAHAQLHALDKYRRNPTSEDRQTDADELWLRFGPKPDFLDRPAGTSLFVQMGKFPKIERQPIRLLESYGLVATAFNRFEDVGFMAGGTIGRNLYWRLQGTSGNPLYFRDPNALAGDNGIKELLLPHPDPKLQSGFPILYNTETEGYFLKTEHVQFGQALGYRWQNEAQTLGYDAVAFHYRRTLLDGESAPLTGTFYGVDIDLLEGPLDRGLTLRGNAKEETGAHLHGVAWLDIDHPVHQTGGRGTAPPGRGNRSRLPDPAGQPVCAIDSAGDPVERVTEFLQRRPDTFSSAEHLVELGEDGLRRSHRIAAQQRSHG